MTLLKKITRAGLDLLVRAREKIDATGPAQAAWRGS